MVTIRTVATVPDHPIYENFSQIVGLLHQWEVPYGFTWSTASLAGIRNSGGALDELVSPAVHDIVRRMLRALKCIGAWLGTERPRYPRQSEWPVS